jgi:hypothetical protein
MVELCPTLLGIEIRYWLRYSYRGIFIDTSYCFLVSGIFVLYKTDDVLGILLGFFIISLGIIISGIVVTTVDADNRNLRNNRNDFSDL